MINKSIGILKSDCLEFPDEFRVGDIYLTDNKYIVNAFIMTRKIF